MSQEIYNEGRVVGLSAWEMFKKTAEAQGVNPQDIPDENKWLASMIGIGASMILKIPKDQQAGIWDFPLPAGSKLSAAGVIFANPFLGTCDFDPISNWARKVTSYSPLIKNTSGAGNNPPKSDGTVPSGTYDPADYATMLSEFVKITDGIVYIKDATWEQTSSGVPYKDINPNYNASSTMIRLYISSTLDADVYILFTGFTDRVLLQTFAGFATGNGGGSADIDKNDWANGGMLGPEVIPWSSKIVFSVPSTLYALASALTRTIPSDTAYTAKTVGGITFKDVTTTVKTNSLIDFNSINITDYYNVHSYSTSPTLQENVTSAPMGTADSYNTIVAWYPGMTATKIAAATDASQIFPPAIYAAQVTGEGQQTLVPLDVAAPGTVKGFENSTEAYNYTQQMPNNYAVYHNTTYNTYSFVVPNDSNPNNWAGTAKLEYLTAPKVQLTVGSQQTKLVSLTDSNGTDYGTSGTGGTISVGPTSDLVWDNLLTALQENKKLDILGTKLHNVGTELTTSNTIGITNNVTNVGAATLTLTGANSVSMTTSVSGGTNMATLSNNTSIKSGTNFIEFSNGLRLYISATNPGTTNVPVGSIGIGWVNS